MNTEISLTAIITTIITVPITLIATSFTTIKNKLLIKHYFEKIYYIFKYRFVLCYRWVRYLGNPEHGFWVNMSKAKLQEIKNNYKIFKCPRGSDTEY